MKWLRRFVALVLTCVVPAISFVIAGQLTTGLNGVGLHLLGLVLAPAALAGGVLVGTPGFLWLDRARPDRPWAGLAIGALAGVVTVAAAFAMLGIFTQPDVPETQSAVVATYLLAGGTVLGLMGTLIFRGIDAVLAAAWLPDR